MQAYTKTVGVRLLDVPQHLDREYTYYVPQTLWLSLAVGDFDRKNGFSHARGRKSQLGLPTVGKLLHRVRSEPEGYRLVGRAFHRQAVHLKGLEPLRVSAREPKSRVSAIPPQVQVISVLKVFPCVNRKF